MQLHNLPFGCMNSTVGSRIVALIGCLLHVDVDVDDNGHGWGKFLRVLVEINFYKPLVRGTTLHLQGRNVIVSFKYECLPRLSFSCGIVIHIASSCLINSI